MTGLTYNYIRELHTKRTLFRPWKRAVSGWPKKVEIDAAWVLKQLVEVFECCMQQKPVRDKEGNPTGEYRFDAAGAARALELIGKHKAVNAFKETQRDRESSDEAIEIAVVHMTKESYDKAMAEQRSQQARPH